MRGVVDPASIPTDSVEILKPDGTLVPDHGYELDLKEEDLREIYRAMMLARRADQESTNLQRQGELGVYTPCLGQEGAQVGAGYALDAGDWVFPSYRELAIAMMRKIDPAEILHMFRGTWHGGLWDPREHGYMYLSVPIATQMLHAVGFAYAAKINGQKTVTLACCGDGATSEGDFHEACNFGGVWRTPTVFLVQNNQYAISVPITKQTAAPTIAAKALGYGFPGVRVDGNDVLACYAVTKEAVRRAREGEGPTLIEAVTFRMGPHSTADDPTRYRSKEEEASWRARDPIDRFTIYAEGEGALTEEFKAQVEEEAKEIARHIRAEIVGAGPGPVDELFENVYSEMPQILEQQYEQFKRIQREREG
ncbi:MAG TPA: pyruvate dehydrogenase (acetyl-transferring) E1 component subunit alpha [Actinomycetota bacterium]